MKYSEFDALINSAVKRNSDGQITGIDTGAIINKVNGYYTDVIKGKEDTFKGSLEDVKKGAINDFLKETGFDSKKAFTGYLEESKKYKTDLDGLRTEIKTKELDSKITDALTSLKVDTKYSKAVSKLLSKDGLYAEDGALKEDVLKENITSIVKDDLMLDVEPAKVGADVDKTQLKEQETRRRKF